MRTKTVFICGIESVVPMAWYRWVRYLADVPPHVYAFQIEEGRAKHNTPVFLKYWEAIEPEVVL